jgi:hypothetical protein
VAVESWTEACRAASVVRLGGEGAQEGPRRPAGCPRTFCGENRLSFETWIRPSRLNEHSLVARHGSGQAAFASRSIGTRRQGERAHVGADRPLGEGSASGRIYQEGRSGRDGRRSDTPECREGSGEMV